LKDTDGATSADTSGAKPILRPCTLAKLKSETATGKTSLLKTGKPAAAAGPAEETLKYYVWIEICKHKHNTMMMKHLTIPLLHPFNGLFSRTTWVSQYQKGKTGLDLNEARDDGVLGCSGISWTICKNLHLAPDNHIDTSSLNFYRPDVLPDANQQCQSTEGQ